MDPNVQAEIERQQSQLLEKLSTIFDNKIDSMKRQLEDVSNKAHESQMCELKRVRFAEPRSFKKKGHEQQYKHNEKVKTAATEAKEGILARKQDACIAKLDEGIERETDPSDHRLFAPEPRVGLVGCKISRFGTKNHRAMP